jgi:hypothetical protein
MISAPPDVYTDQDWGAFPNTVLQFDDNEQTVVDLREPVSIFTIARFAKLGLRGPFGIVTAYNPFGVARPAVMNTARAAHLHATLLARGVHFVSVNGCSPDLSHCEPSFAVAAPCEEIQRLAVEHDQLAIFWFDGERFWIVPARSTAPATPLPLE